MNIESVREFALSLPFAGERCPFGPDCLTLEIGGKMFGMLSLDDKHNTFYNLKCDPEYSIQLQERYRSIRPGWHMNKRHWISVDFEGDVPDTLQRQLIEHAYRTTIKGLPKRVQQSLSDTTQR